MILNDQQWRLKEIFDEIKDNNPNTKKIVILEMLVTSVSPAYSIENLNQRFKDSRLPYRLYKHDDAKKLWLRLRKDD